MKTTARTRPTAEAADAAQQWQITTSCRRSDEEFNRILAGCLYYELDIVRLGFYRLLAVSGDIRG